MCQNLMANLRYIFAKFNVKNKYRKFNIKNNTTLENKYFSYLDVKFNPAKSTWHCIVSNMIKKV